LIPSNSHDEDLNFPPGKSLGILAKAALKSGVP
jgi:hypothetical protein